MTTILFHVDSTGAFLATDTLRHNTQTNETKPAQKLFEIGDVLLAGGGITNGVKAVLKGLAHPSSGSPTCLSEIVHALRGGMEPSWINGNAEIVANGMARLPLVIYLAGLDPEGVPCIVWMQYDESGLTCQYKYDQLGCMAPDTAVATPIMQKIFDDQVARGEKGKVALKIWAFETIEAHSRLFPKKVGAPADVGRVLPDGARHVDRQLRKRPSSADARFESAGTAE